MRDVGLRFTLFKVFFFFGKFAAPLECTARNRLFEWPQFESSLLRPKVQAVCAAR